MPKTKTSKTESRNGGTKVKKRVEPSSPTKKSKIELPQKRGEEEKLFSSPTESRNGGTKVKKRVEPSSPTKIPTEKKVKEEKETEKQTKYLKGLGRRKTSTARIRLFNEGGRDFSVNGKPLEKYFPTMELQKTVLSPFEKMSCLGQFNVKVLVNGGGLNSQAEAIRNGIAKALVLFNPEFRKRLKKAGYLTRDSRMRERKKFGLKRARRAPQWQKR
ncbi:MAG: 30S ribosomal protein S9 [Candidatus Nealsonbacteria bacterium CG_4_10_14_0_2_um_filter_40_15]|uniref:Small ribosomal subunit protein uS9 n=1 Tax=Candidatus Nealsonbacteria bacterium CG_4_10_14_0_2_um_filter_40_15 TaxID=1974682 RepID=A0A2M7UUB5_9BACT|nr:MAG: 30S ribosomal protein S9 [Candidatus Nealsonbacteria bacterium CG_4_10_14_0_2_um_filter_40_15]